MSLCGGPTTRTTLTEALHPSTEENARLTDCYWEKKDWRACKDEVSVKSV
jgi:hypothetical protein